jgi:NAD(P)-dependent dehydrogenase (short-subunit alcohol dehydrogenase family)
MESIKGKTVLITSGNRGIGYETAKGLLQRGTNIISIIQIRKNDFEEVV